MTHEAGVPDRGDAGLAIGPAGLQHQQLLERPLGDDEMRVVLGVAQALEHHHGVRDGGIDGAEAVLAVQALFHEIDGFGNRPLAPGRGKVRLHHAQMPIKAREGVGPHRAGETGWRDRSARNKELPYGNAPRIDRTRLLRHQHEERHDHRARPIGDLAQVEREPARQVHDLDRHHRHVPPVKLAEERELDAREDVDAARAAVRQYGLARPPHVRRVWRIAGALECEVGFHRRGDVEVAAVKQRPATVIRLDRADVMGQFALDISVDLVEVMLQQQVFRGNRDVGLELEHPVPVRFLLAQQRAGRALDRLVEAGRCQVGRTGKGARGAHRLVVAGVQAECGRHHGVRRPRSQVFCDRSAAAAAKPERIAPSIVAGSPVSIQSPASTRFP